jgi:hypothetical protein
VIVRSASFRDLARIEQLYRDATESDENGVQVSDSPVPQATLLRLWHALTKSLSSLVPLTDTADALLVAEDSQEGVVGFIQAQASPGRAKSWQILNLCTAASALGHFAREQLLAALCNHGMEHGIRRFHVRLPLDHPLVPVFLAQRFTQFATEQILYRDEAKSDTDSRVRSTLLRPARRDDIPSIYLLYLRTTPSHVANFEGPSQKVWQATFAQGLVARIGRDDVRQYVAEHPGVVAWAAIRPPSATQPAELTLMCEGHDATLREAVIDAVLNELPVGPAACVLRHYDSELIRALQLRDFVVYGTQLLLVCDLGAKVRLRQPARRKKPILVQAGIAQSVPAREARRGLRP